ncbi:amidohydrolase family protein [Nocardioides anomalus]|uniref:Amidohydrolase family protein n=1 Tax=Nocardioides anomalus TaxID=2712223 RepID=A0A6G6WD20_9ACTN|nr:amidohydrolase family protein [Nocardioides anomalus]QIG43047.1 amidohydrolase family protein [Nocardioides anomalus]
MAVPEASRIIDAHAHWWRPSEHPWYPGLPAWAEALPPGAGDGFNRDFTAQDHRAAAPFTVDGFVHVSAVTAPHTYLDEAAWVEAQAAEHGVDVRLVGTVDPALDAAAIRADLDRQAASDRFAGVRVLYGFEPDSPAVPVVLAWLAEHDKVLDLVSHPAQADVWLRALEPYAGLRVVLEHTGWPESADDLGPWRAAMARLAGESDMVCKLSGLGMVLMTLDADTLRPWVEGALATFGPDRLLFGSNMPIETMGGGYAELVATLTGLVGGPADQPGFWGGHAAATYGF